MRNQRTYNNDTIARWGCYMLCLMGVAERIAGKQLTDEQVFQAWDIGRKSVGWDGKMDVIGANCYVNDGAALINICLELLRDEGHLVVQIGAQDYSGFTFWGGGEKADIYKPGCYAVHQWRHAGGYHWTLDDYNPDPAINLAAANRTMYYLTLIPRGGEWVKP